MVNTSSKVLLECEFTMEKFNLFDNPIVWEKQQQQNDRVKINLNGAVQEPFATTRRYDVELRQDHTHLRLTLKIKGTSQCNVKVIAMHYSICGETTRGQNYIL